MKNFNINFSRNSISESDIQNCTEIIKSGWLTHGKMTEFFEKEISKFTKSKYCVVLSNCTAALHLACLAAKFKKGDEVIVPAQTHVATAHAVELTGAKVVFADIDVITGNISVKEIKKKINKKTKGLIVVHMAGYSCDMKKIIKICKLYKIKLIEDCAHAFGTKTLDKHVGNFGIGGCFSFYPTKQITTGEGGAFITNNKNIYQLVKKMRAFGIDKDIKDRKLQGSYDVKYLGNNYRMTDFQAALGVGQIKRYKKNLVLRKIIAKRYIKNLKNNKKIRFFHFDKNSSYFVFQIFCSSKVRNIILEKLKQHGIGVSVHYMRPVPLMSYYKKKYKLTKKQYMNAYVYGAENISLPVYPQLSLKEVDNISEFLNQNII
jgi:dTDP-4-amino-4,6-dideoxygalactose transaminase